MCYKGNRYQGSSDKLWRQQFSASQKAQELLSLEASFLLLILRRRHHGRPAASRDCNYWAKIVSEAGDFSHNLFNFCFIVVLEYFHLADSATFKICQRYLDMARKRSFMTSQPNKFQKVWLKSWRKTQVSVKDFTIPKIYFGDYLLYYGLSIVALLSSINVAYRMVLEIVCGWYFSPLNRNCHIMSFLTTHRLCSNTVKCFYV